LRIENERLATNTQNPRRAGDGDSAIGSPLRATVGGLSILLVVALALQAGVGVRGVNSPSNDARAAQARLVEIVPSLMRQQERPDPTDRSARSPGMRGPAAGLAIAEVAGLARHAESTGAAVRMDWRDALIARESSLPPPMRG
jgi:hypothetical protein